jgi:D-aminopeptidase
LAVGNGYGKLMGVTQLCELGEIETPIVLTNTLAVPQAAEALIDWTLAQQGNRDVFSVNPIVGETNDSYLNDIRRRALTAAMVRQAIASARAGAVAQGTVGAGTGTMALGWKGGIGTSSRRLAANAGGYVLGALVQSNFGGRLQLPGRTVPPPPPGGQRGVSIPQDGSIMIVLATDAPLSDRNLTRLARRALAGLARTGAAMHGASGDYALAFSTAEEVRRTPQRRAGLATLHEWPNERVSPLFLAAIEATQEAIYNSLFTATPLTGYRGRTAQALPTREIASPPSLNSGQMPAGSQ